MPFSLPLLEWIAIPAGTSTKPFYIAKYPTTNEQFAAFIEDMAYKHLPFWDGLAQHPSSPRASDYKEAENPKLEVNWYEAVAYCRWLSEKTGFLTRLPTEAEWEWVAVGDTGWAYAYGEEFDMSRSNTKEAAFGRTNLVRDFDAVPSLFGAVDMSGNVFEWCLNEAETGSIDLTTSHNRILKGGSWNNPHPASQIKARSSRTAQTRTINIGFRVLAENIA